MKMKMKMKNVKLVEAKLLRTKNDKFNNKTIPST